MNKNTKTYTNLTFARNFKMLMCINDLTLKDIAEKTAYPLSTISTWKRGRIPRDKSVLENLAKIFNTTKESLLSDNKQNPLVFSNEAIKSNKKSVAEKLKDYINALISQNDEILLQEIHNRLASEFPIKKSKKKVAKK